MKFLVVVALLAAICAVNAATEGDTCSSNVDYACGNSMLDIPMCSSRYGNFNSKDSAGKDISIVPEVNTYINSQLTKSYEYLLLSTYYGTYKKNRPGFQKLYQGLSDRSFDDTIDLIKQLTRRGGKVDLNVLHTNFDRIKSFEVNEIQSIALALDTEKNLAVGAFHVHKLALHGRGGGNHVHDPEMAHYIEEKFLGKQAETVRKLSGYANDLSKMTKEGNTYALGLYLFDEYLQKQ